MKLLRIILVVFAVSATVARGDGLAMRTNDIPIVSWMGWSSNVRELRLERITNDGDWFRLWHEHTGSVGERPYINFTKYMVVAIFIPGESKAGYGIFAGSIYETAESITLEYGAAGYIAPTGPPKTLYGMFLLPTSAKRLLVKPYSGSSFSKIKMSEHIFPAIEENK